MKFFVILTAVLLIAGSTFATIRVVDNNPANPTAYQTAQAAHDAAVGGDTIYIVGSTVSYGSLSSSKRLIWIGTGYFLEQNAGSQARLSPATITDGQFNVGSSGSMICGISVQNYLSIYAGNIVVRRCYFYGSAGYNMFIQASSIIVEQCYFSNTNQWSAINLNLQNSHDVTIRNCFLSAAGTSSAIYNTADGGPVDVRNCVIYGAISLTSATFTDNILRSGTVTYTGSAFNNLCNASQFGTANENQENVTMAAVFAGTGSSDAQWQLAEGSPAIGAGRYNGNCGMFGGDAPYVQSGLPAIPTITLFDAPASGSTLNGLETHIQARARN